MDLKRGGAQASRPSDPDHFTGKAWVDQDFAAEAPARVRGGIVTFSPGARTDWHAHPLGQTLLVTAGCGWVQREGGQVQVIRAGDLIMQFGNFVRTLAVSAALWGGLAAGAQAQTLKIGLIGPLTGPGAAWGYAAKGGLEVGGKKHQVEIVAYDDQYKAAEAVAAYQRLAWRHG